MIFVFYYTISVINGVIIRSILASRAPEYKTATTNWLECTWASTSFWTFHIGMNNNTVPINCGTQAARHEPYGWSMFSSFLGFFVPTFLCIVLGLVPDIFNFYGKLFKMIRDRNFSTDALASLTERSTSMANPSHSVASVKQGGSQAVISSTGSAMIPGDEAF